MKKITNMVSSVRNRLLEMARQRNRPFEEILVLYGLERFLYRLSQSVHKDQFILKGGLLIYGMDCALLFKIYHNHYAQIQKKNRLALAAIDH